MRNIFYLIISGIFVIFLSSCSHVKGEYVISKKGETEIYRAYTVEREVGFFVKCRDCNKEQFVNFRVSKEYFDGASCGDTISLDGYYNGICPRSVPCYYDLRKSGY